MCSAITEVDVDIVKELEGRLAACETPEERLNRAVECMRSLISEGESPNLKAFWQVRALAIPLFKEGIHPSIRSKLWEQLSELSREARTLKERRDEESSFATEQIELAISATEKEMEALSESINKAAPIKLPVPSRSVQAALGQFDLLQRELNLLNTMAVRINGLRKELIDIPMRFKEKNQLFRRLSQVGDGVFPRRRELVKEVSELFSKELERFIGARFPNQKPSGPPHELREEIKGLQALAKILTLNTEVFSKSREALSKCWDELKVVDRERKREFAEKRGVFREQLAAFSKKVEELKGRFEAEELSTGAASKELDALFGELKGIELGPKELKTARDRLAGMRKAIFQAEQKEEEARRAESARRADQSQLRREELAAKVEQILREGGSAEELEAKQEAFKQEVAEAQLMRADRDQLKRSMRQLSEAVLELKEEAQLEGSDKGGLKAVLKQRRERRQEIKAQLDGYRREVAASGADIARAMELDELITVERGKLERIDAAIAEIEARLRS